MNKEVDRDALIYHANLSDIPNTPGIYCILNDVNGKIYVGSAVNLRKRKIQHFSALARDGHANQHLQSAVSKYGLDAFSFHVVEFVEDEELLIQREQHYIDETKCYDSNKGYNLSPTAGSKLGVKLSDETRAKIAEALRGKKHSDKTRARMSEAKCGKKRSDETRAKMRGRQLSDETRSKISAATQGENHYMWGKKHSDETRARMTEAHLCWWKRHRAERNALQLLLFE